MMLQTLGINASNPVSATHRSHCNPSFSLHGLACCARHARHYLPCCLTPHRAPQHPRAVPRPAAYPRLLPPATAITQVCVMTQDTARNFLAGSSTKSDQEKFQL